MKQSEGQEKVAPKKPKTPFVVRTGHRISYHRTVTQNEEPE